MNEGSDRRSLHLTKVPAQLIVLRKASVRKFVGVHQCEDRVGEKLRCQLKATSGFLSPYLRAHVNKARVPDASPPGPKPANARRAHQQSCRRRQTVSSAPNLLPI